MNDLITQRNELEDRRKQVNDRIFSPEIWGNLSLTEQNLLRREFNVLTEYSDILRERIGPEAVAGRDVASVGVPEPVEQKQLDDEPASRTVPIARKEGLPVRVVDQQNPAAGAPSLDLTAKAPQQPETQDQPTSQEKAHQQQKQKTAPAKKANAVKAVHPPARVVSKKKA